MKIQLGDIYKTIEVLEIVQKDLVEKIENLNVVIAMLRKDVQDEGKEKSSEPENQ